ncbi:alpha/beta hydrolase family esterase [Cryptosporangium minutisporangium]|uniref:Polyhydroxybutyrate depolymerase n=1 Tax=Cryptosporangium minutisporangium TaxID=113569 RepID=A0ABP6SSN6_9ACTN
MALSQRTPPRLLAALCGLTIAIAAVPVTAGPATAAPAETLADSITVEAAGSPAYRVSGAVTSGGIAVLDDIVTFGTQSVNGRAVLPGGAETTLAITKELLGFRGTVTVDDPNAGVRIEATVNGGVTRVSDTTVRWSGSATVRRGSTSSRRTVTVTVVDRVLDPGNHAVRFAHAGQNRSAIVRVPAGRGGAVGLPALFHFPGLLETPAIAHQYAELEPAADSNGYLLVTPEHFGIGWQGVQAGTPFPDVDDPGYIRALAAVVTGRFGADPARIYSSGMSNGGFFASLTACKLSDVFAAYAPVAGQLNDPASCAPGRPVPVVMFHGDADPLVGYGTTAPAATFWATNNGCDATTTDTALPDVDPRDGTTVIRHEYRNCPASAPVVLYQIVGGGHTWPGGEPYPLVPLGNASKDIDANQVLWEFVSRFSLPNRR